MCKIVKMFFFFKIDGGNCSAISPWTWLRVNELIGTCCLYPVKVSCKYLYQCLSNKTFCTITTCAMKQPASKEWEHVAVSQTRPSGI